MEGSCVTVLGLGIVHSFMVCKSDCKWRFFVLGYKDLNWNGLSLFLMCKLNFVI